ncbi:hypothetical protein KP79_PYT18707 [Mizuhopecten yessoensis]|uniref:Uncharacterized protein n=1 Tax=Mizuhopecten yessoensis TaxID=6573 RepID=A0A210QHZ2_MIZYE|nr:hypothetical protein KP79_PYT18707 [Mizuhopecten yessoensis]
MRTSVVRKSPGRVSVNPDTTEHSVIPNVGMAILDKTVNMNVLPALPIVTECSVLKHVIALPPKIVFVIQRKDAYVIKATQERPAMKCVPLLTGPMALRVVKVVCANSWELNVVTPRVERAHVNQDGKAIFAPNLSYLFFSHLPPANSNDTTVILRDGGHNFPLVAMVSVIFLTLILVAVTTGIFILARRFRSRKQLKRNESIPPTPENEHYSNIANGICVAPVNDHYNSLHEPLPEQTSTNHNMKPYDQMKMISAREGMYDSFHVSQVDMVIGEEYDSVRMSDPKASSQYDHTTTNADRVNRKIANVAGKNSDA